MMLIACSLALLVIYAGIKLLIQTQKEALSSLFKYASWFFIIMGFLILLCISCYSMMHFCKKTEKMMHKGHSGKSFGMGHAKEQCMMMSDYHQNMGEHCGGMMKEGCRVKMEKHEFEREGCHEKMGHECNHRKEKCDQESEECSMNKDASCKKDSANKNMKVHHK